MCKAKKLLAKTVSKVRGACNKEPKAMQKLKELTPNLPPFPSALTSKNGYKRYQMEEGVCEAWDIYTQPEYSITKWYNSKGSKFPKHTHEEVEVITIIKGKLDFKYNTKGRKIVSDGEVLYNMPHEVHSGVFLEDTLYIVIMIPYANYYPYRGEV